MKNKANFISLADIEIKPKDKKEIEALAHTTAKKIEIHRRQFEGVVEKSEEDRTILAYITTNDRDRVDEIVDPAGADLSAYLKNSVLLWGHDYTQLPVGRAVWLKVNDKGIIAKFEFSDKTQFAEDVYQLYRSGILKTFSIGFMISKGGYDEETKTIKKWHLLEVSCVSVPANPEARVITDEELALAGVTIHAKSLRDALHIVDREQPPHPSAPPVQEDPPDEPPGDEDFIADGEKPYPSEHACRLQPPDKFDKFRRGKRDHEGKEYSVIFGHLKDGGSWDEQSYRYDKDIWTAKEAGDHCKAHDGSFEAASGESSTECPYCKHDEQVDNELNRMLKMLQETLADYTRIRDAMISEAHKLGVEIEGVEKTDKKIIDDPIPINPDALTPEKEVTQIELADIDAMHNNGPEGNEDVINISKDDLRQAFLEVFGSKDYRVDVREVILDELDKRLGRMK